MWCLVYILSALRCQQHPRLPSYVICISQLVRFARCCTSVLDFHSKNLQITSKLMTQGYRYHKLNRKTFVKFFRSYSELLSKFGDISFQEYVSKGISHPVFCGDQVCKLRRIKDKVLIFFPSEYKSGLLQPSDLCSLPDGWSIACPIRMSLYIYIFDI